MVKRNCRVCSGTDLEMVLDLGDQPHCDSLLTQEQLSKQEPYYPLKLWFCHDCTTVQIDYTVPKEQMFCEYPYVSATTQTLRNHFEASTAKLVEQLRLIPDDLVVDIGSNDGTWLKCYEKYGVRTVGVEPARNIAAQATLDGVDTLNSFFNEQTTKTIITKYGHPKLVTAAGVFFHLEELHSATRGIAELISHDGAFCVQAIYLGAMLEQNAFDNIYHEHLTYWTLTSIQALLEQYDLEVFHADILPIHAGSLELMVAMKGARPQDDSVETLRRQEEAKGYNRIETYRKFAEKVSTIRDSLLGILKAFRGENKLIHAFGAPAKGATLLNSFDISTELVELAVERNPLKIGKYIPGVRIPIVDELTACVPSAYLVLPWNFLSEFLVKKREFIMNGGSFIVPIPEPIVIDKGNCGQYL